MTSDFAYKTRPWAHQEREFLRSRDAEAWALLMQQRTGKTKIVLDTAAHLYARGRILGLLVVAPNGVHRAWVNDQVPEHLPDHVPRRTAYWRAQPRKHERERLAALSAPADVEPLRILALNWEALSTKRGYAAAAKFLRLWRGMLVLDESHRMKSPSAKRTRAALRLGKLAPYRRILTGTPIPQGPLDFYPQFKFLDETILGFSTFAAFRAHHAEMVGPGDPRYERIRQHNERLGRRVPREVLALDEEDRPIYRNLDELVAKIAPTSSRVRAANVDMPDKIPMPRMEAELTPQQRRIYDELLTEAVVRLREEGGPPEDAEDEEVIRWYLDQLVEGDRIVARNALTRILRLQQVVGGFAALEGAEPVPIEGGNPKLDALVELARDLADAGESVIIWAVFHPEIAAIRGALSRLGRVIEYHGRVPDDEREAGVRAFMKGDAPFFVGHPGAGGVGLALDRADAVIYFSHTWNAEHRYQSEERARKVGKKTPVAYQDIVALDTVDEQILKAVAAKGALSEEILSEVEG